MPSEKYRYLKKEENPLQFFLDEMRNHIHSFEKDRLIELIYICLERDKIFERALTVSLAIQLAVDNWEKIKESIDYALALPDYIPHGDYHYGFLIDEIISTFNVQIKRINPKPIIRAAEYLCERGKLIAANFDDDWEWVLALETVERWIKNRV